MKAACPRDATHQSKSVPPSRVGRHQGLALHSLFLFFCLTEYRQRGSYWLHVGRLSLLARVPAHLSVRSGVPQEHWELQPGLCWQWLSSDVSDSVREILPNR